MHPLRLQDPKRLLEFDAWFNYTSVQFVGITPGVFERATEIKARYNFKLGDSLHLAAAVESRCDRFLTNDHRLSTFTGIAVEVLP